MNRHLFAKFLKCPVVLLGYHVIANIAVGWCGRRKSRGSRALLFRLPSGRAACAHGKPQSRPGSSKVGVDAARWGHTLKRAGVAKGWCLWPLHCPVWGTLHGVSHPMGPIAIWKIA